MKPKRRMGPRTGAACQQMLDATETVLREEGYGAVTSRRVCEVAEIKPQLLYYYFETMDDLILSTFKRRTERGLTRLRLLLDTHPPLEASWKFLNDRIDANLTFEFMALASHHEGIRKEVGAFMETARTRQIEAIKRAPSPGDHDSRVRSASRAAAAARSVSVPSS